MTSTHMIVLPGGGYAAHAPHEAEPVASWLGKIGVQASVFRYPLNVRHPVPLDAVRAEIGRQRAAGAERIGLMGFSREVTWPGWPLSHQAPQPMRRCSSPSSATPSPRWRPRPTGLPG